MKTEVEESEVADGAPPVVEEVVQPVVRGFVKDWDAMEDLLTYVLFTEPLFTPKVPLPSPFLRRKQRICTKVSLSESV